MPGNILLQPLPINIVVLQEVLPSGKLSLRTHDFQEPGVELNLYFADMRRG